MIGKKLAILVSFILLPLAAAGQDLDVSEVIFGHVGDSYEWHITDIGGKSMQGREIGAVHHVIGAGY